MTSLHTVLSLAVWVGQQKPPPAVFFFQQNTAGHVLESTRRPSRSHTYFWFIFCHHSLYVTVRVFYFPSAHARLSTQDQALCEFLPLPCPRPHPARKIWPQGHLAPLQDTPVVTICHDHKPQAHRHKYVGLNVVIYDPRLANCCTVPILEGVNPSGLFMAVSIYTVRHLRYLHLI